MRRSPSSAGSEDGCASALDDFGIGLSSFGYLKTLPVDNIKIDGSFVRDLLVDFFDQAMIEVAQRIGSVMGIATIAEFVESGAVMERLREAGVGYAQGVGVNRPELFWTVAGEGPPLVEIVDACPACGTGGACAGLKDVEPVPLSAGQWHPSVRQWIRIVLPDHPTPVSGEKRNGSGKEVRT